MTDRLPAFSWELCETWQYLYFPVFFYCKPGIKPLQWVAKQVGRMEGVGTSGHLYPWLPAGWC